MPIEKCQIMKLRESFEDILIALDGSETATAHSPCAVVDDS